ncbi:GTP-binding protein RAD-like [Penaeus japonicus]|uniref:GTP-binding protein RAD-like n=1 Tax=Penaeus japonicus TaxID=27405 RepID=UPI001C712B7A|nr:GTP-binding protein RAD-like [Penaeus japonicus]
MLLTQCSPRGHLDDKLDKGAGRNGDCPPETPCRRGLGRQDQEGPRRRAVSSRGKECSPSRNHSSLGNEETGRGSERSVSVVLEGEEAELVFIRLQDITQAIAREGHADGWVVVYAINDRESFKVASTVLGRVWSLGHVTQRAVILVANKTDLQRTRVVTTSEGRTLAMTYECKFIEVSAGIDHNVDELLVGILTQIRLKNQVLNSENQETPGSAPEGSPTATYRMRHKNSFRVKGILNKLLNKDRKTKSCENLHVL